MLIVFRVILSIICGLIVGGIYYLITKNKDDSIKTFFLFTYCFFLGLIAMGITAILMLIPFLIDVTSSSTKKKTIRKYAFRYYPIFVTVITIMSIIGNYKTT